MTATITTWKRGEGPRTVAARDRAPRPPEHSGALLLCLHGDFLCAAARWDMQTWAARVHFAATQTQDAA